MENYYDELGGYVREIWGPGDDGKTTDEPTITVIDVVTGEEMKVPASSVNIDYPDPDYDGF